MVLASGLLTGIPSSLSVVIDMLNLRRLLITQGYWCRCKKGTITNIKDQWMLVSRFIGSMESGDCIWAFIPLSWGKCWPCRRILEFMNLCVDSVINISQKRNFQSIRKCWFLFLVVDWLGQAHGSLLTPSIILRPSFSHKIFRHVSTKTRLIAWK